MAVTTNYGQMQSTIAYEIGQRSDLTTQIQNAIQTAIAKWERQRFYFNELNGINVFSTVIGQEYYTATDYPAIATIAHIDKLHALVSNNRYTLEPRTWQYIEDYSVNPTVVAPPSGLTDYAYYNETIRVYPLPDAVYQMSISGTQRLSALVNSTDSNAWTCDAEALIRCEAKLDLYSNVLYQPDKAQMMKVLIYGDPSDGRTVGYLGALQGETMSRAAVLRVRPSYF